MKLSNKFSVLQIKHCNSACQLTPITAYNMSDLEIPIIYINGKRFTLPPASAEKTLLQYLRSESFTCSFHPKFPQSSETLENHAAHRHPFPIQVLASLVRN